MKHLALIPARSGSKGVPDKNIRPLAGTPLMGYTIEAALSSGVFDEVMVSTDSEAYAEIARKAGAQVPFLSNVLGEDNSLNGFFPRGVSTRRQDHPPYYHVNGAIYIADIAAYRTDPDYFREDCYAYIMSEENSVDIDTELDFAFAELLMERRKAKDVPA